MPVKLKTIPKQPTQFLKENCHYLKFEVQDRLTIALQDKAEKESQLFQKANRKSIVESERQKELAKIEGNVSTLFTLQDCVDCLLSFNLAHYQHKNPNLDSPELIHEVANLTLEVADLNSEICQLKRIQGLLNEINDAESQQATRRYLCSKLAAELSTRYDFEQFSLQEQMV